MRKILLTLLALSLTLCGSAFAEEKTEKKDLTIGFVYVSPVGDAGWSYAHDVARQKLAGEPGITTYFVESVPEGADSERVILNMARKGYDIIVTTSFGFMDPTMKVAAEYPNITFLHCSGYKTAPNVSNFFGRMYQARYLTGLTAGSMTKSNIVGYVAAFPIPEVIRGINAFTLGVREANPKAEVRVVWTKTWYDPATEKEAAKSLLDVGADVIAQHQDSPGPQEAAQEKGVYSIGYNTDMTKLAPKSHLVAAIWNWTPFYEKVVAQVRKGEWKSGSYWDGIETGIVDISPFSDMVPKAVQDSVMARRQEIIDGKFVVFKGPVLDQDGKERFAAGVIPADKDLLEMNWFVQGVIGSTQ